VIYLSIKSYTPPPRFPFEMDSFVDGDTICILEEKPPKTLNP
jgi:hypothetical protein